MRQEKGKPKARNRKYIWTTKDWMLCVFPDNNNKLVWGKTWLRADCCWHFIYFTTRSYCLKSPSCTLYNEALMKQAHSANCKLQSNAHNCLFIYAGTLLIVSGLSFFCFVLFCPFSLFFPFSRDNTWLQKIFNNKRSIAALHHKSAEMTGKVWALSGCRQQQSRDSPLGIALKLKGSYLAVILNSMS